MIATGPDVGPQSPICVLQAEAIAAIERGEAAVAVTKLQAALGILSEVAVPAGAAMPPPVGRAATDARALTAITIELLKLLAPQLVALKGNAAGCVAEAYQQCLDAAYHIDADDETIGFDVFWGLQTCYLVRGDIREALDIGERLHRIAVSGGRSDQRILACRLLALTRFLAGDLAIARALYDDVLSGFRPAEHEGLRFQYASDQRALALAHRAWAATIMGDRRDAERFTALALQTCVELRHPHTSAHVASVLAAAAQTSGNRARAGVLAGTARALASLHGFPYWAAWAGVVLGWCEGQRHPAQALAQIASAIEDYRDTGANQALPYAYLLFADVAVMGGRMATAASALVQARVIARARGLLVYLPEILRVEATVMSARGERAAAAQLLDEAVEIARRQDSGLFLERILETRQRVVARRA